MTDNEKILKGEKIAELLQLKRHKAYAEDDKATRYHTLWGDKTALGLYECINRIMSE